LAPGFEAIVDAENVVCFAATLPAIVGFPQTEGYTVPIRNLRTVLPLASRRAGSAGTDPSPERVNSTPRGASGKM